LGYQIYRELEKVIFKGIPPACEVMAAPTSLDDERQRISSWLSSVDVMANHDAACQKHEPTTGDWLIESPDFEEWKAKAGGFVWLHGFGKIPPYLIVATPFDFLGTKWTHQKRLKTLTDYDYL
jgi:hypothetical protein